ncbi:MAG: DNA repair protein RadA [Lachnospiraceae bacterium]
MTKGKTTTIFFCQHCGFESTKWMGQCPGCKEWNSFVEEKVTTKAAGKTKKNDGMVTITDINEVKISNEDRIKTEIDELDRVLGGGLVQGSLVLVGGDPGIGKSTLLLQVCKKLSEKNRKVLYISGEESLQQIRLRADRIGNFTGRMNLLCETNLEIIEAVIGKERPEVVVIDSIQTMYSEEVASSPGSVTQVREATGLLMQIAKGMNITIFLVGHVTKEGVVAGPRVLEHMVDTVLYFEGDRHAAYRILRGVKNRFGSTNEIGVFEMKQSGLEQVENPSDFLLNGKALNTSGSIVVCAIEGTRPILLEVQALVCQSSFGIPRRTAVGADLNRLNLLIAVLEKRGGFHMGACDAYVNVAGGIKMNEPASDLGIAIALISSFKDISVDDKTICFGEIGLSGEVRGVNLVEQRVQEAKRLGFRKCILPEVNKPLLSNSKGIEIIGISSVRDILKMIQ